MKFLMFICIVISVFLRIPFADDFLRKLPDKNLSAQLKAENFKDNDALIILKEQSLNIEPAEVYYRGIEIKGWNISRSKIMIVKLFNERAVKRYGSFEYNYSELYGDEISCGFEVRARVLKANGKVLEMSEDEIKRIVTRKSSSGETRSRKVLFKVPDLTPGDVLQYEYNYVTPLAYQTSGLFFYNDVDPVLYSNVYITLPGDLEAKYINLPPERFEQPKITQISKKFGSGKTYFWSLKNLNPIREEIFSPPFSDLSLMTAFVVTKIGKRDYNETGTWAILGRNFYKNYLNDQDEITDELLSKLGITGIYQDSIKTLEDTDKIYKAIRHYFKLRLFSEVYPLSNDVKLLFNEREGDASDLSYIMYKILKQKNIPVNAVWIRDKRKGIYELEIPTTHWFNRMAILATCGGNTRLYDFDLTIPENYCTPWYLKGVKLPVLTDGGCLHKEIYKESKYSDNGYCEKHRIVFKDNNVMQDTINFYYHGAPADIMRLEYCSSDLSEIKESLRNNLTASCLDEIDSLSLNNFREDNTIDIKTNGIVKKGIDEFEGHLVINLKNYIFEKFKRKVYSPVRKNFYQFDSPFYIELNWMIEIPDGYTYTIDKPVKRFKNVHLISSRISYSQDDKNISITATIKFPSRHMSYEKHQEFMHLLDEFGQTLEEDIVLTKL